jgi:3-isopropylmalate dehydrogenase
MNPKTFRIVVLPGDGIGPELIRAALAVLEAVQAVSGRFKLEIETHEAGAGRYEAYGQNISDEALEAVRRADATLKGPVGLPWVHTKAGNEAGLLGEALRVGLDLFGNLRPMRLLAGDLTPLSGMQADDIDFLFLREGTESLYLSRGRGVVTQDAAMDTMLYTRRGCERICRLAFELARHKKRGAPEDGKKRVTLLDKSNVLNSNKFFRTIFKRTAQAYPQIEAECLYVDAGAAKLVSHPRHFHVLLADNTFGDILSDMTGALVGGLGMCPSANLGENGAYFEPIHGSAPDIAGKGLANPISQIRSAAMMLSYLGLGHEAGMIEGAITHCLRQGLIKITRQGGVEGGPDEAVRRLEQALSAGHAAGVDLGYDLSVFR